MSKLALPHLETSQQLQLVWNTFVFVFVCLRLPIIYSYMCFLVSIVKEAAAGYGNSKYLCIQQELDEKPTCLERDRVLESILPEQKWVKDEFESLQVKLNTVSGDVASLKAGTGRYM